MTRARTLRRVLVLGGAMTWLSITACASLPSFLPTSTPYPTYTPLPPTPTPSPPRWEARVLVSEATLEFGNFHITQGATTRMIRVDIMYTFNGPGAAEFSPETVLLMNEGAPLAGWARPPNLYRAQDSSAIVNFEDDSLLNPVAAGTTRTDVFIWNWPVQYHRFRLFFPECEPIEVEIP
jgi:hypothetical protein